MESARLVKPVVSGSGKTCKTCGQWKWHKHKLGAMKLLAVQAPFIYNNVKSMPDSANRFLLSVHTTLMSASV